MAKDKNINIKIKADSKEAEKGINKVTAELNKLSKNKSLKTLNDLNGAFSLVGKAFNVVTKTVKKSIETLNNAGEAAAVQIKAETQLAQAAKNNPYLQEENVKQLKNYAGQLQSISAVGDEQLLPLMAQLAAAGRTQTEIQEIMSASLDISASGAMSLESAVKNLNKTYSGTVGELGEAIPQVKTLSKEQLKNGDAVKVISEKYDGMAKKVADSTGGMQKLKNSWGDFTEQLGDGWQAFTNTFGSTMSKVIDVINTKLDESKNKALSIYEIEKIALGNLNPGIDIKELQDNVDALERSLERQKKMKDVVSKTEQERKQLIKNAKKEEKQLENNLNDELSGLEDKANRLEQQIYGLYHNSPSESNNYEIAKLQAELDQTLDEINKKEKENNAVVKEKKSEVKELKKEYENLDNEFYEQYSGSQQALDEAIAQNEAILKSAKEQLKTKQDEKAAEEERIALLGKQSDEENKIQTYINANYDARQQKIDEIRKKYEAMRKENEALGKETDPTLDWQEEKEVFDAMSQSFEDLITKSGDLDIASTGVIERRLNALKRQFDVLSEEAKKITVTVPDFPTVDTSNIEEATKILTDYKNTLLEMQKEFPEDSEAFKQLAEAIKLVDDTINGLGDGGITKLSEKAQEVLDTLTDVFSKISSAMSELSSTLTEKAEAEKETQILKLDEALDENLISEEEYNKKKEEIEKEAAEKEYKIQMWEWSAKLLSATADIATSVIKAYSSAGNPAVGIAMGALMAGVGAVQLASIVASKPIPPSYATGGVVGGFNGASIGEDNTYIHARNGEMILNANQQRKLFDNLNSRGGNGGFNVNIKNYMGDSAEVSTSLNSDMLNIIIDKRVQEQTANGSYNRAYTKGEISRSGVNITN